MKVWIVVTINERFAVCKSLAKAKQVLLGILTEIEHLQFVDHDEDDYLDDDLWVEVENRTHLATEDGKPNSDYFILETDLLE